MIIRNLLRRPLTIPPSSAYSPISPSHLHRLPHLPALHPPHHRLRRTFAAKTTADASIEELQELYATAKDEFEIASEETDKKSVYAADDREAAKGELAKFKEVYERAIGSADGEEIKSRIGSRVRELERAVEAMEERAMED
ncbi:hypothetical protein BDR22DRAFT_893260 [Usnea florida]